MFLIVYVFMTFGGGMYAALLGMSVFVLSELSAHWHW